MTRKRRASRRVVLAALALYDGQMPNEIHFYTYPDRTGILSLRFDCPGDAVQWAAGHDAEASPRFWTAEDTGRRYVDVRVQAWLGWTVSISGSEDAPKGQTLPADVAERLTAVVAADDPRTTVGDDADDTDHDPAECHHVACETGFRPAAAVSS